MAKILKGKIKYLILIALGALTLINVLLLPLVKTNYNATLYLPNDSKTKQALKILNEDFAYSSSIEIMVNDVSLNEALIIKNKIKHVEGVKSVLWLDDIVDINLPVEQINQSYLKQFYQTNSALINVAFFEDDYSIKTQKSIEAIKILLNDYEFNLRGQALANIELRRITQNEISQIMIVIIPLCILILVLASTSYLEPLLIFITLGFAILFNMGTNIIFSSVSNITLSMASVLQLAMSLDYSLFLIHRYYEERNSKGVVDAVVCATKQAFSSIFASCLTTVMGFVALFFMRYSIGKDIGLVLAKGVIFSFIFVIILLPILIVIFAKPLEKFKHKSFIPSFKNLTNFLIKYRHALLILIVIVTGFSYYFQRHTQFNFGGNQVFDSNNQIVIDETAINTKFGSFNPVIVITNNDTITKEIAFVDDLMKNPLIDSVQSLVTISDVNIPRELIPLNVKTNFVSDKYTRFIININVLDESEDLYQTSNFINNTTAKYYDEYYLAGNATSTTEIKETVLSDTLLVTLFSIISIGLVIMFIFKSYLIPFILVGVIQTSIWINMAIPYFQGIKLIYIGYLVVSSLQLGATIDYAVLLSSRYVEFRKTKDKTSAIKQAIEKSSGSIIISSSILAIAGFCEGIMSQVNAIKEIGILIGRGAVLSGILVIFVLPILLFSLDKLILKLSFKRRVQ